MVPGNPHHRGRYVDPNGALEVLREWNEMDAGAAPDLEQGPGPRRRHEPANDSKAVRQQAFGRTVVVRVLRSQGGEVLDEVPTGRDHASGQLAHFTFSTDNLSCSGKLGDWS